MTKHRLIALAFIAWAVLVISAGLLLDRCTAPTPAPLSPLPTPTPMPTVPPTPAHVYYFPHFSIGLNNHACAAHQYWNEPPELSAQMIEAVGADTWLNYRAEPQISTPGGFVPMCYEPGGACENGAVVTATVIAGCNEPDRPDMCDTSPYDYAVWWHDVMEVTTFNELTDAELWALDGWVLQQGAAGLADWLRQFGEQLPLFGGGACSST